MQARAVHGEGKHTSTSQDRTAAVWLHDDAKITVCAVALLSFENKYLGRAQGHQHNSAVQTHELRTEGIFTAQIMHDAQYNSCEVAMVML